MGRHIIWREGAGAMHESRMKNVGWPFRMTVKTLRMLQTLHQPGLQIGGTQWL
jgi:hypothetical protein